MKENRTAILDWIEQGHLQADAALLNMALTTIQRLHLNDVETAGMRAQHVNDYFNHDVSADYLRRRSPFVWAEMVRQGVICTP